MIQETQVFRVGMESPDDVSGVRHLFDSGQLLPEDVVAVLGKTEGNGCVNDFTRGYSTLAFKLLLAEYLKVTPAEVGKRVAFVMSGGTEGVMSPHATILAKRLVMQTPPDGKRLAIGAAATRDFLPEEIGTMTQVRVTADAVAQAMSAAQIHELQDVHFVQIKCPLLTPERIRDAHQRGQSVVSPDTYESMGYSRGAAALGIGTATGEIDPEQLHDADIIANGSLYSGVASTSAGVELMNCEVILLGNSNHVTSRYRIGHAVMKDAIDLHAVLAALRSAGLTFTALPSPEQLKQVVNVFAKADADPSGQVRNRRNTMLMDSDINHTRHARAVVSAVIAGVIGDPMVYVSGGAEHQGPPGGGPVAVIVEDRP